MDKSKITYHSRNQYQKSSKNLLDRQNLWILGNNQIQFQKWLYKNSQLDSAISLLELGSGRGDFWLKNRSYIHYIDTLVVSDYSKKMIKILHNNLLPLLSNIKILQIDAQHLPFRKETFDKILGFHMFYHVPDLGEVFSEITRVLRPNGKLIASTNSETHMEELNLLLESHNFHIKAHRNHFLNKFTLENAPKIMGEFFNTIIIKKYLNIVDITLKNFNILKKYILSLNLIDMSSKKSKEWNILEEDLKSIIKREGYFRISGRSGILICSNIRK